jgi:FlaA1/EpsC-like NDP-sugar epimerase
MLIRKRFSLTATLLSRTLKSALHSAVQPSIQRVGDKITQQTIFSKPTIQQIVQHIIHLSSNSQSTSPADLHKAGLETIKSMIERHTPSRPPMTPQVQRPTVERIVLTGTTGALGSHLLAQLLKSDKVERVWALNRRSKDGIAATEKRQQASFEEKKLEVELLQSGKLVFLESDLAEGGLGLEKEVLEDVSCGMHHSRDMLAYDCF